jgi:2-methylisocitrate lyase-like PEP mutase family enzyme
MAEIADAVRALCSRSRIPLLVDADTGYGNAVNVYATVRTFESGGAAGVILEDQTWPKRCGHLAGKELISAPEMVAKVRAAVDARVSDGFLVVARTDAASLHGVDEAIRRANLYSAAGADMVFADALGSEPDIRSFARDTTAPCIVNMGLGLRGRETTPLVSPNRLADLGVDAVILPRLLTAAALRGMERAISAYGDSTGSRDEAADLVVSFEEIQGSVGLAEITDLETRYAVNGD